MRHFRAADRPSASQRRPAKQLVISDSGSALSAADHFVDEPSALELSPPAGDVMDRRLHWRRCITADPRSGIGAALLPPLALLALDAFSTTIHRMMDVRWCLACWRRHRKQRRPPRLFICLEARLCTCLQKSHVPPSDQGGHAAARRRNRKLQTAVRRQIKLFTLLERLRFSRLSL